jgi:hypothetical protein
MKTKTTYITGSLILLLVMIFSLSGYSTKMGRNGCKLSVLPFNSSGCKFR